MTEAPTPSPLVHISDAADEIGLSQYQLRNLVKEGAIDSIKVKNRVYFTRAALDKFLGVVAS